MQISQLSLVSSRTANTASAAFRLTRQVCDQAGRCLLTGGYFQT